MKCVITTVVGFSLALFTLLNVSNNRHEDYRALNSEEAHAVYGGSSSGGGGSAGKPRGSSTGTTTSTAPKATKIMLSNVPYVSQKLIGGDPAGRDEMYCGIASALMVRAKERIGGAAPYLWDDDIDNDKKRIDDNLYYSVYGERIDVKDNGLLYVSQHIENAPTQFDKTTSVLRKLYTSKRKDSVISDLGHVSGIDVKMYSTLNTSAPNFNPTDAIFNHIRKTSQPAIIIIDSRIYWPVRNNTFDPLGSREEPALHYNVVVGVEETNWGEKIFQVYDPLLSPKVIPYSATQLMYAMRLPANGTNNYRPYWVYNYPFNSFHIMDPCYVGLVKGD